MKKNQLENENLLKNFIDEEKKGSVEHTLARINKSKDLKWLVGYTYSNDEYRPFRHSATKRINKIIDQVLDSINDTFYLAKLYVDSYFYEDKWGNKFIARMKVLYSKIDSIEELLWRKVKIVNAVTITKHTVKAIHVIEQRITELVTQDERSKSFAFLLDIWKRLSFKSSDEFANLPFITDSLQTESNLEQLRTWYQKDAFRAGWDHNENEPSRALARRINEVLELNLLNTKDVGTTLWYIKISMSSVTRKIALNHFAQIVKKEIKPMDLDATIKYRDTLSFANYDFSATEYEIKQHCSKLLPKTLKKFQIPEEVFPYIKKLEFCYQIRHSNNPIVTRFMKLLPKYFAENPDLKQSLVWYKNLYLFYTERIPIEIYLSTEIKKLIDKETDPENLIFTTTDEDLASFRNTRLSQLISSLKDPTPWFLKQIAEKSFHEIKNVFLSKAVEFSKVLA